MQSGQIADRLVAIQPPCTEFHPRLEPACPQSIVPRMTRIFLTLASLSLILLVAALVIGLSMGDLYAQPNPTHETLHWATLHRLTGVAAALGGRVCGEHGRDLLHRHEPLVQGSRRNVSVRSGTSSRQAIDSSGERFPGHWPVCWCVVGVISLWAAPPIRRRLRPNTKLGQLAPDRCVLGNRFRRLDVSNRVEQHRGESRDHRSRLVAEVARIATGARLRRRNRVHRRVLASRPNRDRRSSGSIKGMQIDYTMMR